MKYTPDPNLSDSERLIVIETLLVNTLHEQEQQSQTICRIKRVLWVASGMLIVLSASNGIAWIPKFVSGAAV